MKNKDRLISKKTETIVIRCTPDTKKKLIQKSKECVLTLSAYLIQKGLENIK